MNGAKSITILLALLHFPAAVAETLSDPTRPPDAQVSAIGADGMPSAQAGPVLQGVSLSRQRKSATISGQQVKLGEKFGEATLVRVSDAEAELQNPDGTREVLRLFPQVEKQLLKPAKPQRAAPTKRTQP